MKVSNYVISDRIKRPWYFGFGQQLIGYNVFGAGVSTSAREEHLFLSQTLVYLLVSYFKFPLVALPANSPPLQQKQGMH